MLNWLRRLLEMGAQPTPVEPVPATWLQRPTLAPGRPFPVAGESHYQDALEALAGGRDEDGTITRWISVVLEADPENPYDRQAIQVTAAGRTIGYIPRDRTLVFHPELAGFPAPCIVRAQLTGGWDRGPEDRGTIGVQVLLDWPLSRMDDGRPFLPADLEVALSGEEHCPPLQVELGRRFLVTLQASPGNPVRPKLTGPFVLAFYGSEVVGWLTPTMTPRYLPLIREVESAGIRPTATAVASEGRARPQVRVLMPAWRPTV
jgi:hypothetical protein